MNIELTERQQQALDAQHDELRLIDPRNHETYVLVPAAVYERLRKLLEELQPEDAFQAQIESAAAAGWGDPQMDIYNALDPRRQP